MREPRPFPAVGDLIRKDYGSDNPNTWPYWGEVRAIVDDVLVVKRRPGRESRETFYFVVDHEEWTYVPYLHMVAAVAASASGPRKLTGEAAS